MAKRKRTNNDVLNTTQKTNDPAIRTPLKTRGELRSSGRVNNISTKFSSMWFVRKRLKFKK